MFTLIMPAYNEEKYVREAVESVLLQSQRDFELIAVDDGSEDSTGEILRDLAALDSRITVLSPGRVGKVAALNQAAEIARGKWIYFIGADDFLPPDALEDWTSLVAGVDPNQRVAARGRLKMTSDLKKYDGLVLPKSLKVRNFSGPLALQSQALFATILPIPETLPNEDTWWTLCIEHFATEMHFTEDIIVNYRVHQGNSISRTTGFSTFNEKYHDRQASVGLFLSRFRPRLTSVNIANLVRRIEIEEMRYSGRSLQILTVKGVGLNDRIRALVFSNPQLYRLKILLDRYVLGH